MADKQDRKTRRGQKRKQGVETAEERHQLNIAKARIAKQKADK